MLPSLHRCANTLALVATLALALLPTAGRGWMAHAAPMATAHAVHHAPDAPADDGDGASPADCEFCLVAAGMALTDTALPAVPAQRPGVPGQSGLAADDARARLPHGLGARGPPDAD